MRKLIQKIRSNYMIQVCFNLKGNPRACIWTEPLWGISYNLYLPYVTLFMAAIGMNYAEIGYVTSITMASQMVFAVLSGVVADKMGRRKCTLVFDVLSWSVPELLWMFSQDFRWFAVAAAFNGMWRITENSWNLLLIEDAPKEQIMPLLSLTQLMGLLAAFFTPLSKFAIDAFGLVPTMRVLYGLAFTMMTSKFVILYFWGSETKDGLRRMEATKNQSTLKMLWECKDVYLRIIREKRMILTLGILAAYTLTTTINNNYWALYIRDILGIADGNVALFTTLKSLVTFGCIFVLVPKAQRVPFKNPLLYALAVFCVSHVLLLVCPKNWMLVPVLIISVALEATALSVLNPITSSLLFINADDNERARVCGMVFATVALIVTVFPALIGQMAQVSLALPFMINIGLMILTGALTLMISKLPPVEV